MRYMYYGIMRQPQRSIDQRQRQTYRDARYRPSSYRSLISYLRILGICQRLTLQTSYLDSCGGKISLSWRLPGLWLIWVIGRFNSIIMRTSLRWMWLLVVMMRWVCERGPSYGSVEWSEIIKPRTHIFSFKLADCWFWEKAREAFQRSKFDAIINWAS